MAAHVGPLFWESWGRPIIGYRAGIGSITASRSTIGRLVRSLPVRDIAGAAGDDRARSQRELRRAAPTCDRAPRHHS